jgi:transglutaminase-like putative cysteine protease
VLSKIAKEAGADPRLQRLAVSIFKSEGIQPRDYVGQAETLLRFMQDHCFFVNETGEVLKDPAYTLDLGDDGSIGPNIAGDCDDQAVALASLCRSVHLPVRFVTSGKLGDGRAVRWVEGSGPSPRAAWSHVYVEIGNHPFKPTKWNYADPTVKGAPLGWDVVSARSSDPQLGDAETEKISGMNLKTAATLVGISVASHFIVKRLERAGWI